jgi:hypothetical protein
MLTCLVLAGRSNERSVGLSCPRQARAERAIYLLYYSVLISLLDPLESQGYSTLRFNSRGVGKSAGWASFTGFTEANDLKFLVQWAIDKLANIQSLVLLVSTVDQPSMRSHHIHRATLMDRSLPHYTLLILPSKPLMSSYRIRSALEGGSHCSIQAHIPSN